MQDMSILLIMRLWLTLKNYLWMNHLILCLGISIECLLHNFIYNLSLDLVNWGDYMLVKYRVVCPCGFEARLKYGKSDQKNIFEVYSCPECKNLFTLFSTDERECGCGNKNLVQYNPNKKENLDFYKKMAVGNRLAEEKLAELEEFWKNIKDCECPRCGKQTMKWIVEGQ